MANDDRIGSQQDINRMMSEIVRTYTGLVNGQRNMQETILSTLGDCWASEEAVIFRDKYGERVNSVYKSMYNEWQRIIEKIEEIVAEYAAANGSDKTAKNHEQIEQFNVDHWLGLIQKEFPDGSEGIVEKGYRGYTKYTLTGLLLYYNNMNVRGFKSNLADGTELVDGGLANKAVNIGRSLGNAIKQGLRDQELAESAFNMVKTTMEALENTMSELLHEATTLVGETKTRLRKVTGKSTEGVTDITTSTTSAYGSGEGPFSNAATGKNRKIA